ncbi:MAG: carbohydrate porin [Waddliaceae bacterium]|jgi:hypothetical protein|nr:carbohydrate porin [Waddliaceae bacterium]MBT3579572.1 carbohydrate porin [Waddliaceae bacterium]MBT4444434.1 carbohydrate porin [Waddliaceae bacterium]MBT6928179.1 carbohydrate porin [Waddliaceae bacterium]MBT7264324.1 carbohydrate porin [Waddliaceae bacterium]
MMKKVFYSFAVLSLTMASLTAEDSNNNNKEERVNASERRLNYNESIANKEKRAQQEEMNSDDENSVPRVVEKRVLSYPRGYQASQHWPLSVSASGDYIDFEDGSGWSVCYMDAYMALNWLASDIVYIAPHRDFFSIYDYRLCNVTTGQEVRANFDVGPLIYGEFTLTIVDIDSYDNTIVLSDGTIWNISAFDSYRMGDWIVGDAVIIGVNDFGFLAISEPYILINSSNGENVRAGFNF